MAVDLTEGAAFAPAVTVPQPGDLRKAASVVLFAQQLADRTRYLYNSSRRNVFDVSRAPYNAVGDGTADDTSAIQDALDDAYAAGSGEVYVPNFHRVTAALVVHPGVRLFGTSAKSIIAIDHASANTLAFTSGTWVNEPSIIDGICFTALQANTGAALFNDGATAAQVVAQCCNFIAPANVLGRAVDFSGDSDLTLLHNYLTPRTSTSIVRYNGGSGAVEIVGNRIINAAPAAIVAAAFALSGANMRGMLAHNFFNYDQVTALGTPIGVTLTSGSLVAVANQFKGSVSAFLTAFIAATGTAQLRERANMFAPNTVIPYGAGMALADDSHVDLVKWERHTGVGTTFTWPDNVETLELECNSTVPTITMPAQIHTASKRRLLIKNLSGSTWGTIIFTPSPTLLTGIPGITLATTQSTIFEFEVAALNGGAQNWLITHQGP